MCIRDRNEATRERATVYRVALIEAHGMTLMAPPIETAIEATTSPQLESAVETEAA